MQPCLLQREGRPPHHRQSGVNQPLPSFVAIAKHQFGNYVIQSLLERAPRESRTELRGRLRDSAAEISKSQYGRHVLMQMEKHK